MRETKITLSEDQVIVLFEFFARFEQKERLYFVHPAEYLALMRLAGQLEYPTSIVLNENSDKTFADLLYKARERVAGDFESDFPEIEAE